MNKLTEQQFNLDNINEMNQEILDNLISKFISHTKEQRGTNLTPPPNLDNLMEGSLAGIICGFSDYADTFRNNFHKYADVALNYDLEKTLNQFKHYCEFLDKVLAGEININAISTHRLMKPEEVVEYYPIPPIGQMIPFVDQVCNSNLFYKSELLDKVVETLAKVDPDVKSLEEQILNSNDQVQVKRTKVLRLIKRIKNKLNSEGVN